MRFMFIKTDNRRRHKCRLYMSKNTLYRSLKNIKKIKMSFENRSETRSKNLITKTFAKLNILRKIMEHMSLKHFPE